MIDKIKTRRTRIGIVEIYTRNASVRNADMEDLENRIIRSRQNQYKTVRTYRTMQ